MAGDERLSLVVADMRAEARDVMLIELRAAAAGALPPFEAGAHLELRLPNGLFRHYSLVNDPAERDRYVIGVGRAPDSRGGSEYIHRSVRVGMTLDASRPRNNFALYPGAAGCLFLAGGIGITPIMSMIRACRAAGRPWRLVYAARSRQRAAFYEELCADAPDRVRFHFDDESGGLLDVDWALAGIADDEQVYCCGPAPLMQAVAAGTRDRPPGTVRFEYFTAPVEPAAAETRPAHDSFEVEMRRSGEVYIVPAGKSILEVLEENGHAVPFSCREGMCGTCRTGLCAGEPDHRDYVLSEAEQQAGDAIMLCVSRARSPRLVLDL